jgi:uncharacterized protein
MENKISKYNMEVEYNDGILLYNALTDKILPISYKGYAVIETLMEHLPVFFEKYPNLYASFKKSGSVHVLLT